MCEFCWAEPADDTADSWKAIALGQHQTILHLQAHKRLLLRRLKEAEHALLQLCEPTVNQAAPHPDLGAIVGVAEVYAMIDKPPVLATVQDCGGYGCGFLPCICFKPPATHGPMPLAALRGGDGIFRG